MRHLVAEDGNGRRPAARDALAEGGAYRQTVGKVVYAVTDQHHPGDRSEPWRMKQNLVSAILSETLSNINTFHVYKSLAAH